MNLIELNRSLGQLRLGGIAAVLETRLQQAQAEPMGYGCATREVLETVILLLRQMKLMT
jgi:hypothetical protein